MPRRPTTLRLWLRPELLALHAFAVLAVAVCLWGGFWQLGIYDARQADERADRQQVPTVPLESVWSAGQEFGPELNHRPVQVTGTFAPADEQIWVSGREHEGTVGYWLLAPLITGGSDALLVVRGFSSVAGEFPAVPDSPVDLEVVLEYGESSAEPLSDDRVIGSVRIPALLNELPYRLYAGFGLSTSEDVAAGLTLAELPEPEVSWTVGMRNLAYSLQWWVFGLFAAYMWWRMCSENVADARARASVPVEDLPDPERSDKEPV